MQHITITTMFVFPLKYSWSLLIYSYLEIWYFFNISSFIPSTRCCIWRLYPTSFQGPNGWWRNWYQVWGHGCDTTDSQMSPQPRRSLGCGDIWESVVSQPWPKTRHQFLFYHGTTKLTLDYESLSSQTTSQLPKFKEQSHCKHWVTWPDCFATPSNHCDVTTGLVSLNCIDTLDKKMS